MNNFQLYLTIGVPTFTVILAWISNRADMSRLNDRIAAMNEAQHQDMKMLMGYMIPLHERMAKLESQG